MKPNYKEIEKVSLLEPFERYRYFIKKIADNERIYTLESLEGNWASSTVSGYSLYPVWPAQEFALNCAFGGWGSFVVVEVSLYDFSDIILPRIEREGFLLNVFPVGNTTGFVVKSIEFNKDLTAELENYE